MTLLYFFQEICLHVWLDENEEPGELHVNPVFLSFCFKL